MRRPKIAPSLASAPLTHLAETVGELERGGADLLHFDVEDGAFVRLMTLGTRLISELRPLTNLPFDVHLMVYEPEWIIPEVIAAGAQMVSVHYEATLYPRRCLGLIAEAGASAGLALNPSTPLPDLAYLRPYLSFVVVLTTEPERSKAIYLPEILAKVRQGREAPGGADLEWEIDGGLTAANAQEAVAAGASILVAGRSVFDGGEVARNLSALRQAATLPGRRR